MLTPRVACDQKLTIHNGNGQFTQRTHKLGTTFTK